MRTILLTIGSALAASASEQGLPDPGQQSQNGYSFAWLTNGLGYLGSSLQSTLNINAAGPLACTTEDIASVLPTEATVRSVTHIPSGGSYGEDASTNPAFPAMGVDLPEVCAVWVDVASSRSSSYSFGLFLPLNWNQRFLATGNGGFGGGITGLRWAPFPDMETIIDWGYRSMHGSTVLAKRIVDAYYGSKHKYAYYSGCSTGGRQGLKEVQMYPEDFNGVLAGAPAWWTTHLQNWHMKNGLNNLPVKGPNQIPGEVMTGVVHQEIIKQCDAQDGLVDGIVSDPYGCNFFPEALLCTPSSSKSSCLTPTQLDTFRRLYTDWVDVNQTFVFAGFPLGSELENGFQIDVKEEPSPFGHTYLRHFIYNDTKWHWDNTFDYKTVQHADSINPGRANADQFDISGFQSRGGKLLMWHGLADGLITAGSSVYFYKQTLKALAAKGIVLDDFYRFFLVPGVNHCVGSVTDAPNVFGAAYQDLDLSPAVHSVPGFKDAKHDMLLALMRWVEEGEAPESIIATKFRGDDLEKGVQRQRPICPYPKQARYGGGGDPDEASSWTCENLY